MYNSKNLTTPDNHSHFARDTLDDVISHLAFFSLPNAGIATYWKLVECFGSIEQALNAEHDQLAPLLNAEGAMLVTDWQANRFDSTLGSRIEKQLADIDRLDITLLTMDCEDYPLLLKDIAKPPPMLYVRGRTSVLNLPQIAMVGSRKPSALGAKTAIQFSEYLASSGFVITSGLALGIDTAAHQGAVYAKAATVAVMATGIESIYPKRNQALADAIVDTGGALITEFPLGTVPRAYCFPQRNRIVSGMSIGLLVVEAALKSGSLISARYAMEQNREVFAMPGSIHSQLSRGCHALIKQGAKLVESADDMIEELEGFLSYQHEALRVWQASDPPPIGSQHSRNESEKIRPTKVSSTNASINKGVKQPKQGHPGKDNTLDMGQLSDTQKRILNAIDYSHTPIDNIVEHTALSIPELMTHILDMELTGWLTNMGSGYMRNK